MVNDTPPFGAIALEWLGSFFIEHVFLFILVILGVWFYLAFYNAYVRVDRETEHVDLMKRYVELKMRKRWRL
jgi:hypothetical protein